MKRIIIPLLFAIVCMALTACTDSYVKLVNDTFEDSDLINPVPLDDTLVTVYHKMDGDQTVRFFIFDCKDSDMNLQDFESCDDSDWMKEDSIIRILEDENTDIPRNKWPEKITKWHKLTDSDELEYHWLLFSEEDNKLYVLQWLS